MTSTGSESVAGAYRELIAEHFENTARWRESVAERFPDDARNTRCAGALRAAAQYVSSLSDDAEPLRPFLEFHDELESWAHGADDPARIFETGWAEGNAAARFCFDNVHREPAGPDFDRLIAQAHTEMLEEWREGLEAQGASVPPGSLVEYFESNGVRLWDDEEGGGDV